MKKILYYLREHLEITTREAKSTLAFLLTALVCIAVYCTVDFLTRTRKARYSIEKYAPEASFVKERISPETSDRPAVKREKFRFDPNKATREQLTGLGIPPRTVNNILNYRKKGGKFRYREDLRKIYSLQAEMYTELENWIDLPVKADILPKNNPEKNRDSLKRKITPAPSPPLPIDINTADTTALKKLRGIGPVLAARIIRFRDALGGFHSPEQLDETYGIPPEVLLTLKKALVIGSPVKPLAINDVQNFRHPYIKPYQVKALLQYRHQHGKFNSVQDLHKIKVLDEETIQKIEPYLSF